MPLFFVISGSAGEVNMKCVSAKSKKEALLESRWETEEELLGSLGEGDYCDLEKGYLRIGGSYEEQVESRTLSIEEITEASPGENL